MSNVSEAASWLMWHLVTHDGAGGHGYSQPNRHGTGGPHTGDYSASGGEVVTIPNWGRVTIHSGDYDCSEACIDCYGFLGIPVGGATYTGNERQGLTSTGLFTAYPVGAVAPRDGDILLRSGHTEMVVNGATEQAGFRRSERHSVTGRTGDQDGYESTHSALNLSSWTWIIRYTGPDKTGPGTTTATEKATTAKASTKVPAGTYRVLVDGLNVRTGPNLGYRSVAKYDSGDTVRLDGYSETNSGWVWARYKGASGKYRYIAVWSTDGTKVYAKRVG